MTKMANLQCDIYVRVLFGESLEEVANNLNLSAIEIKDILAADGIYDCTVVK